MRKLSIVFALVLSWLLLSPSVFAADREVYEINIAGQNGDKIAVEIKCKTDEDFIDNDEELGAGLSLKVVEAVNNCKILRIASFQEPITKKGVVKPGE